MCIILYILIFLKRAQQCFLPAAAFMSLTCSSSSPSMLFVLLPCNFFLYENINIFHTYFVACVPPAHVTQKFRPFPRQSLSEQSAPSFTRSYFHRNSIKKFTETHRVSLSFFSSPPFAFALVCFFEPACACAWACVHGQSAPSVLDQLK